MWHAEIMISEPESRESMEDWLQKLTYIQDLLEQWLAMQRSWLYLEPVPQSLHLCDTVKIPI